MKICTECEFMSMEVVDGPSGPSMALVCRNMECRDPVAGEPLPCGFARRELAFCGISGKYWKEKPPEEKAQVIELVKG